MYKVTYYGVRGAQFTKEFDNIDDACQCALQNRYGFSTIRDKNGSVIFDIIEEYDNNIYSFTRRFTPYY